MPELTDYIRMLIMKERVFFSRDSKSQNSSKFIIHGGKPLKGTVEVGGAKNASFPVLVASLLTREECEISNIPLIEDLFRMIEILRSMGVEIRWKGKRTLRIK